MFCMQTKKEQTGAMCDAFEQERGAGFAPHAVPVDAASGRSLGGSLTRRQAGVCTQLAALGRRELQCVGRDRASLGARFGSAIALNLIFAMIFFQIGDYTEADYDLYSHFGALANIAIRRASLRPTPWVRAGH